LLSGLVAGTISPLARPARSKVSTSPHQIKSSCVCAAGADLPARLALPVAAIAAASREGWVGTGPFQILAASASEVRLAAFRDHRDGRPFLDHVTFTAGPEADPGRVETTSMRCARWRQRRCRAAAVRWQAGPKRWDSRWCVPAAKSRSDVVRNVCGKDSIAACSCAQCWAATV
jgi:hypothetical protein